MTLSSNAVVILSRPIVLFPAQLIHRAIPVALDFSFDYLSFFEAESAGSSCSGFGCQRF